MDGDLSVSSIHLKLYTENMQNIPYDSLNYMISVINYGGKITDDMDNRLIDVILKNFIHRDTLEEK